MNNHLDNLKQKEEALDRQINILLEEKKAVSREINTSKPPLLAQMKNNKRKAEDIKNEEFEALQRMVEKDNAKPTKEKKCREETKDEEENKSKEEEDEVMEITYEKGSFGNEEEKKDDGRKKKVVFKNCYKEKRNQYSIETKEYILNLIRKYGLSTVANQTKIPYESLRTIVKTKQKNGFFKARGRPIKHPFFQNDLKLWVIQQRLAFKKITSRRFLLYARKEAEGLKQMGFSWGWLRRFMKRTRLSFRKPTSGAVKPQAEIISKASEFVQEIKELVLQEIYDMEYVFNLDETGVCTETSRSKTLNPTGESHIKTLSANKGKEYTTVLLGGTMTGHKFPALVIFGDKGIKKLKIDNPENVRVYHRVIGSWMDPEVMLLYIRNVLDSWARHIPEGKRALLIFDNYKGHYNQAIKDALLERRIDIKLIPPNTTGLLQPMDLSVNSSFKRQIETYWDDFQFKLPEKVLTRSGNYTAPSRETKMTWIGSSWEKIAQETVAKGFKIYNSAFSNEEDYQDEEYLKVAFSEEEESDESSSDEEDDDEQIVLEGFGSAPPGDLLDYEIYCAEEIKLEIRLSN